MKSHCGSSPGSLWWNSGGWPTLSDFCYHRSIEGAPSLRFLQGRVAMLPTLFSGPSPQILLRMHSWYPPCGTARKNLEPGPPARIVDLPACDSGVPTLVLLRIPLPHAFTQFLSLFRCSAHHLRNAVVTHEHEVVSALRYEKGIPAEQQRDHEV